MTVDPAGNAFAEFVGIVQALRTPGTGCPWDLEQTHASLRPFLIEEAYEVLDAIDAGDDPHLCEELGDLLLQVVLHAQLARDRAAFSIIDVVRGIAEKMVRRHPHVFGDTKAASAGEVMQNWERLKAEERQESSTAAGMERLPRGLPALARAQRLGEKATRAHVDLGSLKDTFASAREHLAMLEAKAQAPAAQEEREAIERELGDLLFTLAQVGRHLNLSAEDALRAAGRRFIEQFQEDPNAR